jgi:hypothetical protein
MKRRPPPRPELEGIVVRLDAMPKEQEAVSAEDKPAVDDRRRAGLLGSRSRA